MGWRPPTTQVLPAPDVESTALRKTRRLEEIFASQRGKPWLSEATFLSLWRLRGIQCRAADGYAEMFWGRKLVLGT
jgi:hypothetical protein